MGLFSMDLSIAAMVVCGEERGEWSGEEWSGVECEEQLFARNATRRRDNEASRGAQERDTAYS